MLIILFPVVLVIRLLRMLTGGRKKPVYVGTIDGDPLTYMGDRPLVIAVWATSASVWKAATEQVIERLKTELAGRCEFAYVECNSTEVRERYKATVVPLVVIWHRGKEVSRFVNVLKSDEIRQSLLPLLT